MHNLIKMLTILSDVDSSIHINCFNVHLLLKKCVGCNSWSIVLLVWDV